MSLIDDLPRARVYGEAGGIESLQESARIRGAMWTMRCNLPHGPRPYKDDNILAMDFYELYDSFYRQRMLETYKRPGYTHAVTGPFYDEGGYHGLWPTQTELTQERWDHYLDAMEEWKGAGIKPVHFVKPDNWTLQMVRERLEPFYRQPRARALLPILVPAGWEPWRYEASTRTWAAFGDWAADVNPDALILLHTPSDLDAPKGTDALYNDEPETNGQSWQYVAPHYHGWLVQLGGFGDIAHDRQPSEEERAHWRANLAEYFRDANRRFSHGYKGWPTGSRFGSNIRLKIYYGEGGSWSFFDNPLLTEAEMRSFGDIAVANGADGYLDGGNVDVP
jgi:hypothetical protein